MRSMSVPDKKHPSLRRGPQRQRVLYPMLPSILDEDSLSAVCTLESAELAFARRQGRSRNQYLHALYLKAMASLGHSHFQPKDLPRQFRQRIAEQLDLEADLGRLLSIERREKSRIVTTVRAFLGLAALSRQEKENVLQWLQDGLAKKETDMAVLINAAIERFKALHVEIPAWDALQSLVQRALSQAKASALKSIDQGLDEKDGLRPDALVDGKDGKTVFDFLKKPVPQATANNLAKELLRIERLRSFFPSKRLLRQLAVISKNSSPGLPAAILPPNLHSSTARGAGHCCFALLPTGTPFCSTPRPTCSSGYGCNGQQKTDTKLSSP